MESLAQDIMEDFNDEGFCKTLMGILESPGNRDDFSLLYEKWVLNRLRLVYQRNARVYFGSFLTPLRIRFPHKVYPPDILAAMQSITAEPQVHGGDVTPEEWGAEIEDVFLHGLPQGVHPGWETLAPYYRPLIGDITIVTGIASHLKSSLMHAMAINIARRHGWHFAAFNPEHHPLGSLGLWLIESYMGRRLHELDDEERAHGKTWITDRFHMIRPRGEIAPTLPWLLGVARVQKERYGLHGLILDPWNYIDHTYDRQRMTVSDYVSDALTMIKRFAEAQEMHVWVVAHPTKPLNGKATSGPYKDKYPPPTPYDISGGAHWHNKMDDGLCCWRDVQEDSDIVEVHIQKVRRRDQCGRPGKIDLRFDGRRFYDIGDMTGTPSHWTERRAA